MKKRVLIIEDEKDMCLTLKRVLEHNNYEVSVAGNIKEGIELALAWKPSGVILDVNLPDGSGDVEIKRIKAIDPDMEVILISAWNAQLTDTYKTLGAKAFLRKPFQLTDLLNTLKTIYNNENRASQNTDS